MKISPALESGTDKWSDQELLYLLEGIEMFSSESSPSSPDIWERISAHVQTRTPSECIGKFIQLPLLTKPIDNENLILANSISNSSTNPIASLIATISTAVHPDIGARAASLALSLLKPDLSNQNEIFSSISNSLSTLADSQLEIEEKNTRQSLGLLVELLSRKVDLKLSILDSLESSLKSELDHLRVSSNTEVPYQAPKSSVNIEALH